MPYIAIILLIYAFLKSFYYGIYEINHNKNKPGGIAVCVLAIFGLIFPCIVIVTNYIM